MKHYTPCCDVRVDEEALRCPCCAESLVASPVNAVLHTPAHKQTCPSAAPAQIVDTEWHALARIAA